MPSDGEECLAYLLIAISSTARKRNKSSDQVYKSVTKISPRGCRLSGSDSVLHVTAAGRKRSSMPAVTLKTEVDRNVDATALQAQCSEGATLADVQRYQRMVRVHIGSVLFASPPCKVKEKSSFIFL